MIGLGIAIWVILDAAETRPPPTNASAQINCHSGAKTIFSGYATGEIMIGDGAVLFFDATTGNRVSISGDCVLREIKNAP